MIPIPKRQIISSRRVWAIPVEVAAKTAAEFRRVVVDSPAVLPRRDARSCRELRERRFTYECYDAALIAMQAKTVVAPRRAEWEVEADSVPLGCPKFFIRWERGNQTQTTEAIVYWAKWHCQARRQKIAHQMSCILQIAV